MCVLPRCKHWSECTQSQGISIDAHIDVHKDTSVVEAYGALALCMGVRGRVCQCFWRMLQLHPGLFFFLI